MAIVVSYTPETRDSILAAHEVAGYKLLLDQVITEGNFMTFEEVSVIEEQEFLETALLKAAKAIFNHENRIRALEGQPAVTWEQFKTFVRNTL
jgi:hypothetical protein